MIIIIGITIDIILAATCYSPDFGMYFDISNLKNLSLIHFNPESFFNNILIPALMGNLHAAVNLFGNILLFVPLGFCGMWLGYRSNKIIRKLVIASTLFSISIELTQMSYGRLADLMDIILNSSGCLLGCGIFIYLIALRDSLSKKGR